ncbi:ABC transporter ATP-binding protein/permease [Rickettsiales bacterium]|nr:ABC transporter ATP-binding protein/permease [Rickettsiales bacterium]
MPVDNIETHNYDSTKYLVNRLLREYIAVHKNRVIVAFFFMIIVAASTAGLAYLMEPVLDDVFIDKDRNKLFWISLAVVSVSIVKGISLFGQSILMRYIGQRIVTNMQAQLYDHLLHADIGGFVKDASGKFVSRFTNDIMVLRRSVSSVMTGLAKEIVTLIFLVGLMFYQNFTLAIIAFAAFPVAIYPISRLGKRMRKVSRQTQEELGKFTERLDETFKSIRIIKAYGQEDAESGRARKVMENIFHLYMKAARTDAAVSPIMESLGGIAIAAVIWYGGVQVIEGVSTPGAFFSFMTALIMAYRPAKSISSLNTALQEGLASAKRLFELLDKKPEIIDGEKELKFDPKKGSIIFDEVCFSYDNKKSAIDKLSFKIEAGKKIALVGPSGGGKSTIMNLLLRFYDVEKGQILIGKNNINEFKLSSLRGNMSYVGQDITLFDDSVAANIAYGNPKISKKKIKEAAKLAAADEFIEELPQGYDTFVGQNGITLSGGQRQRIAIARAILKDSPILLLDEATSALDSVSEKKIQKGLEYLTKGKTTIIIAHRLSTVEDADIIYVLRQGSIIQEGRHADLMKKKGPYQKLYKGMH